MKHTSGEQRRRIVRAATITGGILMIIVIIWIDVATGIWQDLVILAGLAAGFVSFFLTSLVLKSVLARATAKRWAPVNRIAITEFLHAIVDDERSEVAHSVIVPRALPTPDLEQRGAGLTAELRSLRETVVAERRELSEALSRWAEFLTTTGDNDDVLQTVARIAFQLDQVRDAALVFEAHPEHEATTVLATEIAECNELFARLVAVLKARLDADNAFELDKRKNGTTAAADASGPPLK